MFAPSFDPVAISLGSFQLRWYGMMYLCAFLTGWLLARYRAGKPGAGADWTALDVDDMLTGFMLGVIAGGRLGYVLFYDLPVYLADPLEIFRIWNGGMSFHGGLLGVMAAMLWFAHKKKKSFWQISDFVAPLVAPGLFFGRIGNFINGELWGKVSDAPWAVLFPHGGDVPRHPSQLYEAALEGLVLFVLVWLFSRQRRPWGAVSGLFALGYGLFRFMVEFVRLPDPQLGYLAFGWLTMGQVLCLPLIFIGLWLLLRKGWQVVPEPAKQPAAQAHAKQKKRA
ncbi:MAG: prolipoprotein diacylglyceryl transferase [Desulfovibrionaceae bacterium]|nr:prolipoprotein diacylglyceryl transferase [Desulfovibrionaceae bacterium]